MLDYAKITESWNLVDVTEVYFVFSEGRPFIEAPEDQGLINEEFNLMRVFPRKEDAERYLETVISYYDDPHAVVERISLDSLWEDARKIYGKMFIFTGLPTKFVLSKMEKDKHPEDIQAIWELQAVSN